MNDDPQRQLLIVRSLRIPMAARANAAGIADAQSPAVPPDEWWDVRHIVLSSTSVAVSAASIYFDDTPSEAELIDFTATGNRSVGIYTGLLLAPTQRVLVEWTGATASATCMATLRGYARRAVDLRPVIVQPDLEAAAHE